MVKGSNFTARERLRVVAEAGSRRGVRVVRTSSRGGFALSLRFVGPWDPCSGPLIVTASGGSDHVSLKRPGRECPPAG
jgi:hypothetical protein